ncbi:MAG: HPF/RaiA family ribosome-associated protein [Pseudobdellovibrionaceae bacterium]
MKTTKSIQVEHEQGTDVHPEVKAYIYQQIQEFEPFVTPETIVGVIAKKRKKKTDPKYRIEIVLTESGTKIKAEAKSNSIYRAIQNAKEKLIQHLSLLQDEIVTSQDRIAQINQARQNGNVH